MSSSTSCLEESGVWCGDEGSGDDLVSSNRNTLSVVTSPKLSLKKTKHSGGSVDASGDVAIIDLKDFERSQKCRRNSYSSRMMRKNSKRKTVARCTSGDGDIARKLSMGKKRRSSSFSKLSSGRKTAPQLFRRPSFDMKARSRNYSTELGDDDVMWPGPEMFKPSKPPGEMGMYDIKRSIKQKSSPFKYDFSFKRGSHVLIDLTSKNSQITNNNLSYDQKSFYGNVTTYSMASRPSVTSSIKTTRCSFDDEIHSPQPHESTLLMSEKKMSMSEIDSNGTDVVAGIASIDGEVFPIDEVVENINLRNFIDKKEKPRSRRTQWLTKQLTCLYITTMIFIAICLLLLALTIWLSRESTNLRLGLSELKDLISACNHHTVLDDAALATNNASSLS